MTNQTFFNATFIARKVRVLRNGEVPIILRITIAGQRAELNINRTVNPDMWVAAKGMSRGKSRADIELNRYLCAIQKYCKQPTYDPMAWSGSHCSIKSCVNNVMADHFERYKAIIEKRL